MSKGKDVMKAGRFDLVDIETITLGVGCQVLDPIDRPVIRHYGDIITLNLELRICK